MGRSPCDRHSQYAVFLDAINEIDGLRATTTTIDVISAYGLIIVAFASLRVARCRHPRKDLMTLGDNELLQRYIFATSTCCARFTKLLIFSETTVKTA